MKPSLKSLQMSIETIMPPNWIIGELYALVYLAMVSHSVTARCMNNAQRCIEKVLTQIQKIKAQASVLSNFIGTYFYGIRKIVAARDVCFSSGPNG